MRSRPRMPETTIFVPGFEKETTLRTWAVKVLMSRLASTISVCARDIGEVGADNFYILRLVEGCVFPRVQDRVEVVVHGYDPVGPEKGSIEGEYPRAAPEVENGPPP